MAGEGPPCKKIKSSTKLRTLGFCGADDSVHPNLLGLISQSYPLVEFRPDKEGQPRYATKKWVARLAWYWMGTILLFQHYLILALKEYKSMLQL
mmetsp:Transcript_8165/g.11726  ORF Transcript_8165/g.11726 Transcript_8165/m.11726 type:complete len:94 (-) Transcript_8165:559-840(-)